MSEFSEVSQEFYELEFTMDELNHVGAGGPFGQVTQGEIYELGQRNSDFQFIKSDWARLQKLPNLNPGEKSPLRDLSKRVAVAGALAKALVERIRARQARDEFAAAVRRLEDAVRDWANQQTPPPYVPGPNNPLIYPPGGKPGVQPGAGVPSAPPADAHSSLGGGVGPLAIDWNVPAALGGGLATGLGLGPLAIDWTIPTDGGSPQSKARAAIAARDHGDETAMGPGTTGGILAQLRKGDGRGPGLGSMAGGGSKFDTNLYTHRKRGGDVVPGFAGLGGGTTVVGYFNGRYGLGAK